MSEERVVTVMVLDTNENSPHSSDRSLVVHARSHRGYIGKIKHPHHVSERPGGEYDVWSVSRHVSRITELLVNQPKLVWWGDDDLGYWVLVFDTMSDAMMFKLYSDLATPSATDVDRDDIWFAAIEEDGYYFERIGLHLSS